MQSFLSIQIEWLDRIPACLSIDLPTIPSASADRSLTGVSEVIKEGIQLKLQQASQDKNVRQSAARIYTTGCTANQGNKKKGGMKQEVKLGQHLWNIPSMMRAEGIKRPKNWRSGKWNPVGQM